MSELFKLQTQNISFNKEVNDKYKEIKTQILKQIKNNQIRPLGVVYDEENLKQAKEIGQILKNKYKRLYLFGIGGSILSSKALGSLRVKTKIEFIDFINQSQIEAIFKKINKKASGFLFISKSGQTSEILALYSSLKNHLQNSKYFKENCYFIVTDSNNILRTFAQENHPKQNIFNHEEKIGGRFSFFSLVGLVPAYFMGFNVKSIINGAKKAIEYFEKENSNISSAILATLNSINTIKTYAFMPYVYELEQLNPVLCQIWAESIGKNGFGITPYPANGTADQHSQLQLYLEGPKDKLIEIMGVKSKEDGLNALLQNHMQATLRALGEVGQKTKYIELEKLDEEAFGFLLVYYFLNVISACYFLKLNPFDQNGVELIKKYISVKI
jgi:glucose-6-phosphate isomerase